MRPISWHIGKAIGKLVGGKANSTDRKAPNQQVASVEWRMVNPIPEAAGKADFGEICGVNLGTCRYFLSGEKRVPILTGSKLSTVMIDCVALSSIVEEARRVEPSIPSRLDVWFDDAKFATAEIAGKTKTGRSPKYPLTISVDISSPRYEPVDYTAWIQACLDAGHELPKPEQGDDSLIAHIRYLPDGTVGAADVYMWSGACGYHVAAGGGDGQLHLTMVERKLRDDNNFVVTYSVIPGSVGGVTKDERREKLAGLGVDVRQFTTAKVSDDAAWVIEEFLSGVGVDLLSAHIDLDFSNPTKSGKAPKNVAIAQFSASPKKGAPLSGKVTIDIKYLKDGSMNMADIEFERKGITLIIAIRKSADGYAPTWVCMETDDMRGDLFSSQTRNVDARRAIAKALKRMQ
ncbi:hypothetical protein [Thermophilibacter mediterraneus]|uniref:hypothetical protein n=1 Tax=Thermophilibacter mediterraneus TaxID=1871031 RepID=UPI000931CE06|nr:hypothetical protein [Thermophilibacter mediterraneus]